jgi:predicted Zn-dependent peptidase
MMFSAGHSADQFAKPGTAKLVMNLLMEGTKTLTALQVNEKVQLSGSRLYTFSDLDASYIYMDGLKASFDGSMDLFTDIVRNPAFAQASFNRLQEEQINEIRSEKADPNAMARRVITKFLYGEGHAYHTPFTGSGYEKTVRELKRADVVHFYETWIKPNNATLTVVGDIEMKDLLAKMESRFGDWAAGKVPSKNIAMVSADKGNRLYLMDRPESQQSVIIAGYLTEPYGRLPEIPREALMNIFAGDFMSRLNLNLREDKHWAYGSWGYIANAKGQRPLLTFTSAQTDKTKESVLEIKKEFKLILSEKPITKEEFERTRNNMGMKLPGKWETNKAVLESLIDMLKYELPPDFFKTYSSNVEKMTLDDLQKLSKQMIHADKLSWVIVGDKDKILKGLEEVGFDEIVMIDADGNVLSSSKGMKP